MTTLAPERIKVIRIKLGLNIKAMADLLGVDRDTYSKWERGERPLKGIGAIIMCWLGAGVVDIDGAKVCMSTADCSPSHEIC